MEGLFRARKASQCSDFIPFLELWREEGHSLGLEGTLSSGFRLGGGCCPGLGSGPTDCPLPEGTGAEVGWSVWGYPLCGGWGGSINITTADVTDPAEEPGPQRQGNPNPSSD